MLAQLSTLEIRFMLNTVCKIQTHLASLLIRWQCWLMVELLKWK
jgi:hypothetical protein